MSEDERGGASRARRATGGMLAADDAAGSAGFETSSMAVRIVGSCLVFVHGAIAPTDSEWDRSMDLLRKVEASRLRLFVWTEGAAPNAGQRAKLKQATEGSKPPTAVLTDSVLARAAGTAIAWFNPEFRVFAQSALDAALDHLKLDGPARADVVQALDQMRSRKKA
jgi:hypothetical protein